MIFFAILMGIAVGCFALFCFILYWMMMAMLLALGLVFLFWAYLFTHFLIDPYIALPCAVVATILTIYGFSMLSNEKNVGRISR